MPEYWVIDVAGEAVIQHWEPRNGAFAQRVAHPLGAALVAATLPGLSIETDGLI